LSPRVRVNPFGIALPDLGRDRDSREEDSRLLFAGNLTHPPNVDAVRWLMRELMPAVRARAGSARLTIVGSPVPDDLAAAAPAWVEFAGEVPAVRPYLERAAVVLAPIRQGG